jgi:predicted transcriptional regulator
MKSKKPKINGKFDYKKFADHILNKRNAEGLTLRDMSKQSSVSAATCYRAEAAKKTDISNVIDICNWLEKPLQYFLTPTTKK